MKALFLLAFTLLSTVQKLIAAKHDRFGECLPSGKDHTHFNCYATKPNEDILCVDHHPQCSKWSKEGECDNNPSFMLPDCPKSCSSCLDGHCGITQLALPERKDEVAAWLSETRFYMHTINRNIAKHCQNENELCTFWATRRECETRADFMQRHCAPACRACEE